MPNIYINQINIEFEETPSYHDILTNSSSSDQSLVEEIQAVSHIYVNQINIEVPASEVPAYIYVNQVNLEVPIAEVPSDTLTCTQHGEQTIEEIITGTPVPEPVPVVGGGAGQRIRVIGGRPWSEEDIYVISSSTQSISEEIFVEEIAQSYADNISSIQTKVRRPIYAKPRRIEILSFSPTKERTVTLPIDKTKINSRKREEEELLLLGII